jgi:hypothetical protein
MIRELALLCLVAETGCSLVLDFSDSAIPIDAAPFTVEDCSFGEPNNTFQEATPYVLTELASAAICGRDTDDRDFYKITIPPATATLTIEITGFESAVGDLDLYLYNGASQQQALSAGVTNSEKIVCPGAAPRCDLGMTPPIAEGDYIFEVRGATPGTQNRYDIAITLTSM